MSSRHADGIQLGGLISALLDNRADKEMRSLFESYIVREALRQSCDQSCVAQSVIHFKGWQHHGTFALHSTTPISSVA